MAEVATPGVRTIAVISAGVLGRGIAHAAALAGYRTILEDILPATLRKAEGEIRSNLDYAVQLGKVARDQADAAIARIEFAHSVEDAARAADLVIEAVPDEVDSKIEIFTLLERFCRPDSILVTTASSTATVISVSDLAEITFRPQLCVGMRFVDLVREMSLIEVVLGTETSDATRFAVDQLGRRMGLKVVEIRE